MKTTGWILGVIVVVAALAFAFTHTVSIETQQQTATYQNTTYGYAVMYPLSLQTKEYTPEDTVFGHIEGDTVDGVAEARVITVEGQAGETLETAITRELTNLCTADGPTGSFSCTGVESSEAFSTDAGGSGVKLYLHGEMTNFAAHATSSVLMGPYYVMLLRTSATASQALVIHPPLNKKAAEADEPTIEAIAKSVTLAQ
ncbi:MAG TPA: hypothetical protein VHD55_03160 [Candidatus Paceibacterota bacterium]|nr:hypothetical protein [Candidatus Paceibacterota bacterium]